MARPGSFGIFVIILLVILLALFLAGTSLGTFRIIGYIFVTFGIIVFLLGGILEEGLDLWGGSPWLIKVAAVFFILGLILVFIQF